MEMEKESQVLLKVPDCADRTVNPEMDCLGVADWDLQDQLAASVQLAKKFLAIEKPGVRQFVRCPIDFHLALLSEQPGMVFAPWIDFGQAFDLNTFWL
jgi:hypothetical protein